MIIDARNLNLNPLATNSQKVSTASQTKTEKLVQNLDKVEDTFFIRQDSLESLIPQSSNKTDTYSPNTDYFDVSQIKIVRLKEHYERDYTADKALSNAWLASSQNSSLAIRECGSKVSDEAVAGMSKSDFFGLCS